MRQLATIRTIDSLSPIKGADRIELAHIGGWQVVVKKDEFKVGDLAIYLEIDSWVPHSLAPFLTKDGHYPKVYNEVEGQRLKTVKLRGEISQGLLLPITDEVQVMFAGTFEHSYEARYLQEGDDVTEVLGIQKWEKPLAACLAGTARGNFPSEVPKTDQARVQNINRNLEKFVDEQVEFEVTEKLHGSSGTFYLDVDGVFHVCSRNIDLKETESNSFWKIAKMYDIEAKMRELDLFSFAIQGEVIGEGINGNQYGVTGVDFYVFDMYDVEAKTLISSHKRISLCSVLGLKIVPLLGFTTLQNFDASEQTAGILKYAEGKSALNGSEREGVVFKSLRNPNESFKAVSNKWLLNGGEDQ